MSSIVEAIVSPYKAYKRSKRKEKELKRHDSLDTAQLESNRLVLVVKRDLDEILQKYIDSDRAYSVRVEVPANYMDSATEYLKKQQIEFVVLSETNILIEGD